jgi:uncharacterized protein YndB with AHSA1/START domain
MMTQKETLVSKDAANKNLVVTREFDAPVEQVWKAWTQSALLDQWWAPKPYQARTKTMDFREGGHWLYAMVGPDGSETWCRADYKTVDPGKGFTATDAFCDAEGKVTDAFPNMHWDTRFVPNGSGTKVTVLITFANEADMQKILEMGFEPGFTAALGNLDEVLAEGKHAAWSKGS